VLLTESPRAFATTKVALIANPIDWLMLTIPFTADGVLKNATDGTLLALYDITVKLSTSDDPFKSTDDIKTPFDKLIELMIGRPVGTAERVLDAPITFVFVINNRLNEYVDLFVNPLMVWEYAPGEIGISKLVLPYDNTYFVGVPAPILEGSDQDRIIVWFFGVAKKLVGADADWKGVTVIEAGTSNSTFLCTGFIINVFGIPATKTLETNNGEPTFWTKMLSW